MSLPPSTPSVDQSIDYDKLAAAFLRQSKLPEISTSQLQQGQHQIADTQDHTHLLGNQPPQQTSASKIGAILDQVFLGEPARSAQPVHNIQDGIPLGASVSSKIKSKIWNHEYIDFRSLIDCKEEPLSVTISTGVINLHQGQKTKYPIPLNQWTDAFFYLFGSLLRKIYLRSKNLFKYGHMIREMQYLHGDNAFRQYDEQFRKLKETINVPWQIPVQELRLKVASSKLYPAKLQQKQSFRPRVCYQYNKGERCNRIPCPYKHLCLQCKANHSKTKCPDIPKTFPSPVLSAKLHDLLFGYDPQKLDYLITGFSHGFHLDCVGPSFSSLSKNHKCTDQFPWVIHDFISEGKLQNRIAGPFSAPPI